MANRTPDGVHKFSGVGKPGNSAGKKHPKDLGNGLDQNGSGSGKQPNILMNNEGSTHFPALDHKGDGTDPMGSKPYCMQATKGGKSKPATRDHWPSEGLSKHDGLKAPNRVKK